MCSHHACFHDDVRDSQTPLPTPIGIPFRTNGQENERPRTNREPLTPVMPDLSFNSFRSINQDPVLNVATNPGSVADGNEGDIRPADTPGPSMPDTLVWPGLDEVEPNHAASLPPIPSQCLMPSQPSSTTSSARIAYLKPFAGKGLQTLSGVRSTTLEPLREQSHSTEPEDHDAAENDADQSGDDQTVTNTPRSIRHREPTPGPEQTLGPRINRQALNLLSNTVRGHELRIENLESISFSAAAHDTCHEKHDQADLRVTELESRVEEVEKILNDNACHTSGHSWSRRGRVDDTAASVVSFSTSTGSYIMDRAELQSELRTLKAQLSQLQGASPFPSLTQPWEVEVVFLPFPLRSIWLELCDFSSQRPSHGGPPESDLWMQLPNASEPQSPPGVGDWPGPEVDSDWLLGRACAPDNMIGQRLRSRGLVKNITVRGPDARSVQQAMSDAFGTLFRTFSRMQANVHHGSTIDHRVTKFLGLQSPWVPLRKLHKDSRLRFLSPAEMVTSVSWDVQFLASSVVMKSHGVHRLFITHPEAYLQDQYAYENGWTWQRLRELSRVYADSQSSQEILEGNANEECWAWNNILDEPSLDSHAFKAQLVQASAQEHWRAASTLSSSQYALANAKGRAPSLVARRSSSRTQSPAIIQERRVPRPIRTRPVSMPPAPHPLVASAVAKRRVTPQSQRNERHASPQPARAAQMVAQAKRRGARSPSYRLPWSRFTPRWSTASPSPGPEVLGPRGATPSYATPHSNAPFIDARSGRGGVNAHNDDDIDFDISGAESGSDINVFEECSGNETNDDDSSMVDLGHDCYQNEPTESWQEGQAPEDEVWPGIEDEENRDPGVSIHVDDDVMVNAHDARGLTIDNLVEHDTESQGSSVPSEYPSNQPPWVTSGREQEFRVPAHT